jgi:hypothetical protein
LIGSVSGVGFNASDLGRARDYPRRNGIGSGWRFITVIMIQVITPLVI